jgi:hypothetical protein
MEIKVRAVEDGGEKSVQEVEQELLEKHEESLNNEEGETNVERVEESVEDTATTQEQESVQPEAETQTESSELNEEDVLSYLGKRYNKEINSFDDLITERESSEELPEDVAAYLKFKKETGRGFNDFVNANKNYDDLDPNQLLKEYYRQTESELDEEDIDYLIEDKFGFDEDLDEESEIKKKSIAKKKELSKAKNFFNDYKEKYSVPLESSTESISEDKQKELDAYQKYIDDAKSYQEELVRKAEWFEKKTKELFNNDFKGFDFKINDKELTYSPSDADELLKSQIDVNNFVGKYLDDKGMMKDAKGYHRALSIAMNPDKFAQFFYEQGKSDAVTESAQKSKNINFSGLRQTPEVSKKGGTQVKALSSTSSRGLKIRSKNKS